LRAAAVLGLVAISTNVATGAVNIFFPVYVAIYAGVLLLLFLRLPYLYRAALLLLVIYGFGLRELLGTGILGAAPLFFVGLIVMTGFLLSPRVAALAAVISLITVAISGWLIVSGQSQVPVQGSAGTWLIGASIFVVTAGVIVISVNLLQARFHRLQQAGEDTRNALAALQTEKTALENNDVTHSLELWRKTNQLRAASEVARQITEIRDLSTLLQNTVRLAAQQFEFYHVGLFLVDENSRYAVLQAASSEGGQKMLEGGHRLEVGAQGIVGFVAEQGRPRVALDVGADAVYFDNPNLPLTSSEMALPLIVRDKIIGVLDIQSEKPHAFQQEDVEVMQTLADQLAVAIENARLFSDTQSVIGQLEAVTFKQTKEAWQNYLKRRTVAYQYTPLGIRATAQPSMTEKGKQIETPLNLHGQQIGTIQLQRKENAPDWTRREEELVQDVARQVALALDNNRLLEDTNRRIAEEQTLGEITSRLGRTLDFDTLLQTAVRELSQLQDVAEVSVYVGPAPEKKGGPRAGRGQG
jgi:GAF domain-containing protein